MSIPSEASEIDESVPQLKLDDEDDISDVNPVLAVSLCAILGFIFGLNMERSFVFAPVSIREQFTFQRFLMLKANCSSLPAHAL